MALLVWVMVGLALWHFTVFLPDNFYGGIVGAFCGALLGSVIFGIIVNLGSIPGESETDLMTGVEAIPGALIGLGIMWWLGVRQLSAERAAHRAPLSRRFAAHTAQSRSPAPVSEVRRSLSAGPKARAQREVRAHDPHAAGVVLAGPAADGDGRLARERADEAPAGAQHPRDLGERVRRAREAADAGWSRRRRRTRRRRRAAWRPGRREGDELVRRDLEVVGGETAEVEHAPVDPEIAVEVAHGGHRRVVEAP